MARRVSGDVLLAQMVETVEVLKVLLGILQKADLSLEQRAAVRHWKRALPDLLQGVELARKELHPSKKAAPSKAKAQSS